MWAGFPQKISGRELLPLLHSRPKAWRCLLNSDLDFVEDLKLRVVFVEFLCEKRYDLVMLSACFQYLRRYGERFGRSAGHGVRIHIGNKQYS